MASGRVDDLRAEGARGRIYRVAVDAPASWADALAGVTTDGRENGAVLVRLGDDADEQAVLDAARAAGLVQHFARVELSLAELFREAVTS